MFKGLARKKSWDLWALGKHWGILGIKQDFIMFVEAVLKKCIKKYKDNYKILGEDEIKELFHH